MSSIPLPALDVRPPAQQENPLDQYARIMQIKQMQQNAPLQTQALQQQVQSGQLDIQDKQRQQASQSAIMDAYHSSNGDLTKTIKAAADSGKVLPGDLAKLQQANYQVQTEAMNLYHAQGQKALDQADFLSGAADAVSKAPPEAKNSVWQQQLQNLQAQNVDVSKLPPQYPGDDQFKALNFGLQSHKVALENVAKNAEAQKDTAQAKDADTNAQLHQMEIQNGGTSAMSDSRFRNILMNQKLGRPVSAEDQAWAGAYKQQKTLNPVTTFNLQNAGATTPGPNGQPSALATAVANGQMKWGDVISPRTPMSVKQQFAAEVQKINPQFDTSTYGLETKAAEKATSGTWADTRLAYNTALDHSQLLIQAAKALQNGDVQALNSLKNKFGTEFGSTGPITFNAIANAYNHEVTSVVAKGHMTDKEVETGGASLPSNASMPQIMSVVGAYNSLMSSKRNELDKLIKASAGGKANGVLNTNSDSDSQPKSGSDPFAPFGGKSH